MQLHLHEGQRYQVTMPRQLELLLRPVALHPRLVWTEMVAMEEMAAMLRALVVPSVLPLLPGEDLPKWIAAPEQHLNDVAAEAEELPVTTELHCCSNCHHQMRAATAAHGRGKTLLCGRGPAGQYEALPAQAATRFLQ